MERNVIIIALRYAFAVSVQDYPTLSSLFADDIVWHQAGNHRFSGTYRGRAAVAGLIAAMSAAAGGTLKLTLRAAPMVNGTIAAVPVHFTAHRDGVDLAQDGIDLIRIENSRIAEVSLFSADQVAEDAFWDASSEDFGTLTTDWENSPSGAALSPVAD